MPRVRSIDTRQFRDLFFKLNSLAGSSEDDNFLLQLYDRSQTPQGYLTAVRSYRPKALQVWFFKTTCPNIPNSLLELFLDVSPASISIVGTARDVYSSNYNNLMTFPEADDFRESDWKETRVAYAMASCLGYTGVSEENNNLPQLRQPRSSSGNTSMLQSMNPMAFSRLKMAITSGFEDGYEARDQEIEQMEANVRTAEAEDVYVEGATNSEVENFGAVQEEVVTVEEEVVTVQGSQGPREFTVTDASVRNADNTFYYIGYQNANSGSLYNRSSELKKFPITTSDDKVNVFYFAMLNQEVDDRTGEAMDVVYYYQLQWGDTSVDGGAENQVQITTVAQLQRYFKNNTSRLNTTDTLNLYRLNLQGSRPGRINHAGTIRALSEKALQQTSIPTFAPTYFTSAPDGSTQFILRSDEKMVNVNGLFKEILREQEIDESRRQAEIESSQEVLEAGMDDNKLIEIQRQTFDRGFGVEIEGNFDEVGKGEVATLLTNSGFPTKSTHYHGSAPSGHFKLESDGSVQNDLSTRGGVFEMVSPLLRGEQGLDKLSGVLAIIRSQGARTSPSAGTHIHFGYADFGDGREGFEKRKRLIVNYCVLQPFLLATQILQSRNRSYARKLEVTPDKIKALVRAQDYSTLRQEWRRVGGGRGALHLKEDYSGQGPYNMRAESVPTYEFRFPASNFESDTITNMVRLIEKIWSASIVGYVPHTVESSKPLEAEEWLEDLLGQELFSFWKNRYRDLQSKDDYVPGNGSMSDVTNADGRSLVSNKKIPKLNNW